MSKKQLEKVITKKCKDFFDKLKLEYKGFYFYKTSDRFTSAIPDFYIAYKGQSAWIELKRPKEESRPLQKHTIRRLKQAGIPAFSTDDFDKVKNFVMNAILI